MVIMVTTNYTYSYSKIFRLLLFPVASVIISQTVQCFTATYKFKLLILVRRYNVMSE